jgi:formate hydrogenlyase subunit 6/NADH:ubiquinone oxidoreductase subunit I
MKIIMRNVIYYFSGTGNSYSIAKQLNQSLDKSELIPIAKIWQESRINVNADMVGFVFPLYYWGLPRIVKEFMVRLHIEGSKYLYAVVTRAGEENGIALAQLEQILAEKNTHLNAGFFIQMPSNYILGYHVDSESENQTLFEQLKVSIKDILTYIHDKKGNLTSEELGKIDLHSEKLNKDFRDKVLESDKHFNADEKCTGCGICEKVCPVKNIKIIDFKPEWLHQCQQCLACINYCPEEAIQYGRKTLKSGRYHHPEISYGEISIQQKI